MSDLEDTTMIDVDDDQAQAMHEEHLMYGKGQMTEQELDEKYPNRPHNKHKTPRFADLYLKLFNPLNEQRKASNKGGQSRKQLGPQGKKNVSPAEMKKRTIQNFIDHWKKNVGNDFFPAMRLIIPDKDRDRAMYGLKEATIAKLLIKAMGIGKDSPDAKDLLNWKQPGRFKVVAGDFASRCQAILAKRHVRTEPGNLTIAEVNHMLDQLSTRPKEDEQYDIMKQFYDKMNADELLWLIRIILREIKIGSTERTILELWHPDAENLFNISSSLRRVCWELYNPDVRLDGDKREIELMQCFQPQLAAFQAQSIEKMVTKMQAGEHRAEFWIEEKLDGERMQLHMMEDDNTPGGKRFCYWSRKAKNYTYLYGESFHDKNGALTKHLKKAFAPEVRNIILDGEMITWNTKEQSIEHFGGLKTAANDAGARDYIGDLVPVFKVFDCLYLNDKDLTRFELRDRRRAMESAIQVNAVEFDDDKQNLPINVAEIDVDIKMEAQETVHGVKNSLEVHKHIIGTKPEDVHEALHRVVGQRYGEGLLIKNPLSAYKLNERTNDWSKVKPEYMAEFGESIDVVVIGGYYGTGRRSESLSSFLCGLRADQDEINEHGLDPQTFNSFCKVGGGFRAQDYRYIRGRYDTKFKKWDPKKPPKLIRLAGKERQFERPDLWIKPEDSFVVEVKAAAVVTSDLFYGRHTLRFPRFVKFRSDKNWTQTMTLSEFRHLKNTAEKEKKAKQFHVDERKKMQRKGAKRQRTLIVQGQNDTVKTPYAGPNTGIFEGMSFMVMTDAQKPLKKSKAEIKDLIKQNGGLVVAARRDIDTMVISDRRDIHTAAIIKKEEFNVVRPKWLYDCVNLSALHPGSKLLPFEPSHLLYTRPLNEGDFKENADKYGDPFNRDLDVTELSTLLQQMSTVSTNENSMEQNMEALADEGLDLRNTPGLLFFFTGLTAYFDEENFFLATYFQFAGGNISTQDDPNLTHIVIDKKSERLSQTMEDIASRPRLPRLVVPSWIEDCWSEKTRLDEESYAPI